MNNNIKISLSIQLQGSTLVRQEVNETVTFVNKKTGKKKQKTIKTYQLVPKPAVLSKQMTKDAYDYMVSLESCPAFKKKEWKKMTETERLEYHLADLCKFYHGNNFTYHVFED